MSAGYSKTPLVKKLGIKPGFRVYFVNLPDNLCALLGELPAEVSTLKAADGVIDYIQLFTKSREELRHEVPVLKKSLAENGMLWISWPKKASRVATEVDEQLVRSTGLQNGLVDVKICAVDEVWSGLKFVYRLKDRK